MLNKVQQWLMRRYCPDYEKNMPEDKPGLWRAEAIIVYGYWTTRYRTVASRDVNSLRQAYMTARWLALKAQWLRPSWLFDCGVAYGVKPLPYDASHR